MTSRKLKHLLDTRYPNMPRREALQALQRDMRQEIIEAEEKARREREALEQQRRDAEAAARAERLAQAEAVIEAVDPAHRIHAEIDSTSIEDDGDPSASSTKEDEDVDMADIAQVPRRKPRRRLNPVLAALVGGLLIGMKGDER